MEVAVGAGAEDYADEGEEWHGHDAARRRSTPCSRRSRTAKIAVKGSSIALRARRTRSRSPGATPRSPLNLAEALDDHDDVQNVYADFDISDEELATSCAYAERAEAGLTSG